MAVVKVRCMQIYGRMKKGCQLCYLMQEKRWQMQRVREFGLKKVLGGSKTDGSVRITKTMVVTGKGQQYFINKFL